VIHQVEHGEVVEVTRRRRVVARLTPVRPAAQRAPWPDLDRRARAVFGETLIEPPASAQVARDRGEW